MKKPISITIALISVFFISTLIINHSNAQNDQKGTAVGQSLPPDVQKIVEKSCFPCHSQPGNMMAVSHLDFTSWNKYAPEKKAAKAKDMCTQVTKAKMPQKGFLTKHPDAAVTTDGLNTLCNWANSLQGPKK